MLSTGDKLRLMAKSIEFRSPTCVVRALHRVTRIPDPFLPEDDHLQAIFIHIPKSAGSSLRLALYNCKSFHIPAIRYQLKDPEKFEQYFKFCFVRNPWSRLLSAYDYLYRKRAADMAYLDHRWSASHLRALPDFQKFVLALENPAFLKSVRRYIHFRDQLDWIAGPGGARDILVDYIGRYETLSSDYAEISSRLRSSEELPEIRTGNMNRDYRAVYTTRMVDVVANIYRSDIEAFQYSFE